MSVRYKRVALVGGLLIITLLTAVSFLPKDDIRALLNDNNGTNLILVSPESFSNNQAVLIGRTPNSEFEYVKWVYKDYVLKGYNEGDLVVTLEPRIMNGTSLMWRNNVQGLELVYDEDEAKIVMGFDVVTPYSRVYVASVNVTYSVYPFKSKPRIQIFNTTTNDLRVQLFVWLDNHADGERIDADYNGALELKYDDVALNWSDNVLPTSVYKYGNGKVVLNYPKGEYDIDPTITVGGVEINYLLVEKSHPAWDSRLGKYYYSDITGGDLPLAFKFDKDVHLTKDKISSFKQFDIDKDELNLTSLKVSIGINRTYNRSVIDQIIPYNVTIITGNDSYVKTLTNYTYKNVTDWRFVYYDWKDYDEYTFKKDEWYIVNFEGSWEARLGDFAVDLIPQINSYNFNEYAWWNSSWGKRKSVYVSHNQFVLNASWQIPANVSHDNDMVANGTDLRFVDNDNSTLLDSWREDESSVDSDYHYAWFELASSGNQTVWMYYSNSDALDVFNCDNVFLECEFEDGSFANETGNWKWYNSALTFTDLGDYANMSADANEGMQTIAEYPIGTATVSRMNIHNEQSVTAADIVWGYSAAGIGGNGEASRFSDSGSDTFKDSGGSTATGLSLNTIYRMEISRPNTSYHTFSADFGSTFIQRSVTQPDAAEVGYYSQGTGASYVWYWFVRNITNDSVNPTISFGSEEENPTLYSVKINSVAGYTVNDSIISDSTPNVELVFEDSSHATGTMEIKVNSTPYGINYSVVNNTVTNITVNASLSDAYYVVAVYGNVSSGYSNVSDAFGFVVETEAPSVTLNNPANQTYSKNASYVFNYTLVDEINNSMIGRFYLDGALNNTNSSVLNNTLTNVVVYGMTEENHTWFVSGTDGSGTTNSANRTLVIDLTSPVWSLDSDNHTFQKSDFYINWSLTELYPDDSTDVYSNDSWATNNTDFVGSRDILVDVSDWGDGEFEVLVGIKDLANNFNSSSVNVTVDLTDPTQYFISPTPANNTIITVEYINVNVSSNDTNFNSSNVILEFTNSSGTTNYTMSCEYNSTDWVCEQNVTNLDETSHSFYVYVTDLSGRVNVSEWRVNYVEISIPDFSSLTQTVDANPDSREDMDANVTITSGYQVSTVYLETNLTGSAVNYTVTDNSAVSSYMANFTLQINGNLSVGEQYYFKFHANNTVGWNTTATKTYVVRNLSVTIEFFENGTLFDDNTVDLTGVYLEFNTSSNNGTFELYNQSVNNITITLNNTGDVAESYKLYLNESPRSNHTYYVNDEYSTSTWTELNETEQFVFTNVGTGVETNLYFWVVLDEVANYTTEILQFFLEVWEYV